ncbi:asparagine synthase [Streptomyces mashuensis]|uniref:asparagine synthase (glutamine-hydrolyzing) n=1 Tax=Streptomyces mashuensis TaxID=33904 RepID=A0A919ECX0_9ACTN|nr:asparagine synthase-related protein [Streptomyces mashuensis]GHF39759.1 asparagine synthase [Streptomyces mashuensis]
MVGAATPHFVVLPDHESAAEAARRLPPGTESVLTHRSGRPWVAGRLVPGQVVVAEHGGTRLAVIGHSDVTEARLAEAAARVRAPRDLDRLGTTWAGSFHLVAHVGDRLHIQGSASGLRRVFHGRLDGLAFAADRADVLAALLGASLDRTALALRLLPSLPHPLADRTPWRNVTAVPPGTRLVLSPDGRHQTTARWWQAPEPVLSLEEGATELARALEAAVRARTRDTGTVTLDLSGGLDSTSLTMLAARERPGLTAFTMDNPDDADDDLHWAQKAAAHLPQMRHVVYPSHDLPGFFGGFFGADGSLLPLDALPDEPAVALSSAPRIRAVRDKAVAHGSRLHIDGFGGDQLLTGHPAYDHDLLRSRPLLALKRLRTLRALAGPAGGPAVPLRDLLDGRSYGSWLATEADALTRNSPAGPRRSSVFAWGGALQVPGWLTPEARHLIGEALRQTARTAHPLAPTRGRHGDLLEIQSVGRMIRQHHQLVDTTEFTQSSPFLDDRVLHVCLAVRPEQRATPWEFKPLIKTALAGVLPRELLTRRTKGDGGRIAAESFEKHRRELAGLFDSSHLAELGLVDPAPLRELFRRPYSARHHERTMPATLACELWIRTAQRPQPESQER